MAYADNLALLAEDEIEMKSLIERLDRYFNGKGLKINIEKTKVISCRKGGRSKWKGRKIEEVGKYTYLGYTIMRNGRQEAHIERIRKRWSRYGELKKEI